jgi:hypothetical protein
MPLDQSKKFSDKIMTTEEAAAYLSVSPIFLAKARVAGRGPKFSKLGGAVRYRLLEIHRWMDKCEHSNTAQYKAAS